MVVINYLDQLQQGIFEHVLHHLIDTLRDLSVFYPTFKNEDGGRPAYDPAILLKVIQFACSKGITSSRGIEGMVWGPSGIESQARQDKK